MARFDVHRNRSDNPYFPLLLDIQSELHDGLATRVVVPLAAAEAFSRPLGKLQPV